MDERLLLQRYGSHWADPAVLMQWNTGGHNTSYRQHTPPLPFSMPCLQPLHLTHDDSQHPISSLIIAGTSWARKFVKLMLQAINTPGSAVFFDLISARFSARSFSACRRRQLATKAWSSTYALPRRLKRNLMEVSLCVQRHRNHQ